MLDSLFTLPQLLVILEDPLEELPGRIELSVLKQVVQVPL